MSDCDAILDALTRRTDLEALPPSASAHLRDCSSCRRVLSIDHQLSRSRAAPIRQGAALAAALDRDMAPVRFRSSTERSMLPLGAVGAVMLAGATLLGRPTAATSLPWLISAALFAYACAGVSLVLHRGASGLGVPVRWRRAYMGGALTLFAASAIATTRGAPSAVTPNNPVAQHFGVSAINAVTLSHEPTLGPMQNLGTCASTGLVFAGVVALGLLWASRRTVPVSSGSMGAVVGASAGLAAAASLQLSCATTVGHALAAHGLPMLLAMVLCTFVGRRALAP